METNFKFKNEIIILVIFIILVVIATLYSQGTIKFLKKETPKVESHINKPISNLPIETQEAAENAIKIRANFELEYLDKTEEAFQFNAINAEGLEVYLEINRETGDIVYTNEDTTWTIYND